MIDSTPATDFTPPAAATEPAMIVITPPAFQQLPKEAQRRIWENWKRQQISVLSFTFEAMFGVNPKSLQE